MIKNIFPLAFIVATRFFGLFIILPVISLEVLNLNGGNAILAGVAIGIYAIMQMIFSVPFGYLSDIFGRKIVITIGLLIFIIGSLVCALASDIWTLLLGRSLQGTGAVGGVAIALISDFVKEENRAKAMSFMGMMIGLSFALAMVISPWMNAKFGFSSLFYLSAILTLICIVLLYTAVGEEPKFTTFKQEVAITEILKNKNIMIMNLSNFLQKTLMIMAFFLIPIVLVRNLGLSQEKLSLIYAVAMVFGFLAMGFSGFFGEVKKLSKQILIAGICAFGIAYLFFGISEIKAPFIVGIMVFFLGFNLHEPLLQSVASKFSKSTQKGVVLGIFNACGYFGTFCGGVIAGIATEHFSIFSLSLMVIVIVILWLFALISMTNPHIFKNLYLEENLDLSELKSDSRIVDLYQVAGKSVIKYNSSLISQDEIYEILGKKNGQNLE